MKASVGIDIGTTSISFAVWQSGSVAWAYSVPNSATIEELTECQDAEQIYGLVENEISELVKNYDVEVIGLAGQMHGIVYTDKEGRAVSPLYTWKTQNGNDLYDEGQSYCEYLYQKTGANVSTGYGLVTHFVNLSRGMVLQTAEKLCTIADYVGMRLTGRTTPLIHTSQAAALGFFDVSRQQFQEDVLTSVGMDSAILPEVCCDGCVLGTYRDIPVYVSIGDNQASFIGGTRGVDCLVNMGTGGQVSVKTSLDELECVQVENEILEKFGLEVRPLTGKECLLVYSSLCGGRAYAVFAQFVGDVLRAYGTEHGELYTTINEAAREAYQRGTSLVADTRFCGVRGDAGIRGSVRGIDTENLTLADMSLAILCGMSEELCGKLEEIQVLLGREVSQIAAAGNGIRKNPTLQKIFEDRLHKPLQILPFREEAAVGCAIFALGESV